MIIEFEAADFIPVAKLMLFIWMARLVPSIIDIENSTHPVPIIGTGAQSGSRIRMFGTTITSSAKISAVSSGGMVT